ncbi:MAG: hypothetical protein HYV09_32755 [Deltaproteobacteria bacterium]|nr:hypothetical protein [Deltaproteobacteria bacterium]
MLARSPKLLVSFAAALVAVVGLSIPDANAESSGNVDSFYGSFGTEVPIEVPKFHALEPRVKLAYTSSAGNGLAGAGWSISGFGSITRASKGAGAPKYDATDVFYFDGQELVPCASGSSSPSCMTGGTHSTKIESYGKIRFDAPSNTWTVWQKDGTRSLYVPVYDAGPGIFRWGLSSVADTHGNAVSYGWWCDPGADCYPDSISYNGTSIRFYREARPDPITFATGASIGRTNYRLKSIDVTVSGARARAYKLSYTTSASTSNSLLASVQQFGTDAAVDGSGNILSGSALPAMTFGYDAGALSVSGASAPPSGMWSRLWDGAASGWSGGGPDDGGVRFGDFDGDGRTDVLWMMWECQGWYNSGCEAHRELWLNKASGWALGATPPTGGYFVLHDGAGRMDGGLRVADVNGDGKSDLIWSQWECTGWYNAGCEAHRETWLSTGTGWVQGAAPPGDFVLHDGAGRMDGGLRVADVNGDGKSDLIWSQRECTGWYNAGCEAHRETWLSTGSGWVQGAAPPGGGYFAMNDGAGNGDGGLRLADVNGDGKADLVWSLWECNGWYGDGCAAHKETWLSTGDGWTAGAAPAGGGYFAMNDGAGYGDGGLRLADVNGDGKADLVWSLWECVGWFGDGCQAHRETWLSTGRSWIAGAAPAGGGYFAMNDGAGYADGGLRLGDVNGDGKSDLIWSLWECVGWYGDGCQAHRETWLSTGTGWNAGVAPPTGGYFTMWDGAGKGQGGLELVDLDGDGAVDVLWQLWECTGWYNAGCEGHREAARFVAGRDVLTWISNGLGGSTSVGYRPSTAWANTNNPPVVQTVATLTTSDGRGASGTTSYRYEGGLWSSNERRFLGFRKVTGVIDAAGDYTETYYHQHVGCISKPETTYYRSATGAIYSYSSYGYAENATAPYTSVMTDRWDYECNLGSTCRRVLTQIGYDAYGNAIQTKEWGDYDAAGDERTTVRGYSPNGAAYIVAKPAYENVYEGIGTAGALKRQTLYEYDANGSYAAAPTVGELRRKKGWNSLTGGYSQTSYGYDAWGNQTSETDALGYTSTTAWDASYHLYPVQKCDPMGRCSSQAWNAALGVMTSSMDANGNTTSFTHDALSRPRRRTSPDGGWVEYSYLDWGNPNLQRTRETRSDGSPDGLWKDVYQDGLGRTYLTVEEGGYRKSTVYSDTSARVWMSSLPYATGAAPAYQVFAYDGAGRLRTVTNPDGTVAEHVYANGQVTTYDELGHAKVTRKDGLGRVIQVLEKLGATYLSTLYRYDALGNLVQTTDAKGNVASFTWDSLGRKTGHCDPDLGCWSHAYDAVGHLVSQTDAKGQTTTFAYDALGRMLTKTLPGGAVSRWTYDEAWHGASLGKPTTVSNGASSESLTYDFAGRVTTATSCVTGVCLTMRYGFDTAGRPRTVTYPDGEVVTYTYGADGRLQTMGYASFTYNAAGQPTTITYANGTTTAYTYDQKRLWLQSARVTLGGGTLYESSYGYDAAARVTSMTYTGVNGATSAGFAYDDLNRLTSASKNGLPWQSFTYDAIGNMTGQDGVGTYAYADPAHKHAVSSLSGAINTSFVYDANGNTLSGNGRTYTYDAENRVTSVNSDGQTTSFQYDVHGNRVEKSGVNGVIRYFGQLLEKVNGLAETKYYYAGSMLVAERRWDGATYYHHRDHVSSVRLTTDASGAVARRYEYRPFGFREATSGTVGNEWEFGGHRTDAEHGLSYMGARYYDALIGRFLTPDTVVPDPLNPQAFNRYAYVLNNPISNADPTGHVPVVAAVVTAITVAASTAPVWVTAMAYVGAAATIAGYVLENPTLMTIGSVLLGFSGGYAFGAGFLAGPGLAGGIVTATVAAATSPLSPLDPGIKQAVGWAFTAQSIIHGLWGETDVDVTDPEWSEDPTFAKMSEKVQKDMDSMCGGRCTEMDRANWAQRATSDADWAADWTKAHEIGHFGSEAHQQYGLTVQKLSGGRISAGDAMLMNPCGGMVGAGCGTTSQILSSIFPKGAVYQHALVHDASGFLKTNFSVGVGYTYAGQLLAGASNPLGGQVTGILYNMRGRWVPGLATSYHDDD